MSFSRCLIRALPVLVVLAALLGPASAQVQGVRAFLPSGSPAATQDRQPGTSPRLRILDRSSEGFTIELTAGWDRPLAAAVSTEPWATIEAAVGGQPVVTEAVDLPSPVAPVVTIVATEFDEVRLPFTPEEAEAVDLTGPVADVAGVGIERRRARGTVVIRLLHAEDGVLRRYRRVVARVTYPAADAPLAASRDASTSNPHLDVTRSVLAEGTWFKVPVRREGIYRIDRSFIQQLGLNPDQIDPDRVKVFGNGGAPVPRLNRAPRLADLAENPSMVVGGGDGRFDAADGVYFYASAPSGWRWTQSEANAGRPGWVHFINPYSSVNYYFIRVDGASARRVETAPAPAGAPVVLERVQGRLFVHEDRPEGMVDRDGGGSGLDWLGQQLTRARNRIVVLDTIPDALVAGQVRYRGRVAARSPSPVTLSFQRDGQVLSTTSITASQTSGTLFRAATLNFSDQAASGQRLRVDLSMTAAATGSPSGWIDYVEAFYEQELRATQDYLRFVTPGGQAGVFEFVLSGFSGAPEVWDVSRPDGVRSFSVTAEGGQHRVRVAVTDPSQPVELVAFRPGSARTRVLSPAASARVPNQNLHGIAGYPDYVIVTAAPFRAAADELAAYRADQGLRPLVVDIQQVYNEFSGGLVDPTGLRDFLRFLYDRGPGAVPALENVLLFGNGHYDYRGIRPGGEENNWIPTYQTDNSSSYSESFTSDDFFGLLEPDEGLWPWTGNRDRLDIGIGRLPVNTPQEAADMVRKIQRYEDPATQGAWRSRYTLLSDDHMPQSWDTDLHVQNSEVIGDTVVVLVPSVNLQKIYMAMYPLQQTALGARYPAATAETLRGLEDGTLIWNYSGHGGPDALADERLITREDIRGLGNLDRLTIAITATCSFGRYDLFEQRSGGEEFVVNPNGGAVAIFTTTRVVYTGTSPTGGNLGVNLALNRELFRPGSDGRPRRLGDAYRAAKARMVGSWSLDQNGRKFNLLGDPAMRIGLPERGVRISEVNGLPVGSESSTEGTGSGEIPTLRGQELATIAGEVLTLDGRTDASFSGEVEVTVYDVARTATLPAVVPRVHTDGTFRQRSDVVYRGRATVRDGRWAVEFIVPRDISYAGGAARISAYVSSVDGVDGLGFSEAARIGTTAGPPISDTQGPRIQLFLNDTTFVSGGLVGSSPVLIARLSDDSGINMAGAGVGHEMLLVINGQQNDAINVGSFYRSDLDTYRSGTLRYSLPDVPHGPNSLSLTAWDVVNNASTATLDFVVEDSDRLRLAHSYPYPNPTTGPTRFVFEHNQLPGTPARVQIRIYTINGRPIRTLDGLETLPAGVLPGSPVQIEWDGRDEDLDLLATGIYLYRVRVEIDLPGGERRVAEEIQRLAIIR